MTTAQEQELKRAAFRLLKNAPQQRDREWGYPTAEFRQKFGITEAMERKLAERGVITTKLGSRRIHLGALEGFVGMSADDARDRSENELGL